MDKIYTHLHILNISTRHNNDQFKETKRLTFGKGLSHELILEKNKEILDKSWLH